MADPSSLLGGVWDSPLALIATAVLSLATAFFFLQGQAEVPGKKTTELSCGSLSKDKVEENWKKYDTYFQQNHGDGVAEKQKAPEFVDTFYNLVTDIYEWGWGQSFHFSPAIPGKSHRDATRMHEEYVAKLLELKPGMKALDAGCGVGGPMRAIAKKSGAKIVGITINEYQVQRARSHNARAGLSHLCEVVRGSFLEMPFENDSFDAAFSIEATCHAPKLEEVYGEIFRVLKPGQLYATYEWVTTNKYDKTNPDHVKTIDAVCHGNALPELRSYEGIAVAAKKAGFEVLIDRDLAAPPAKPWWMRLKMGRVAYFRNHIMVAIVTWLGIAPKGLPEVHNMLTSVAVALTKAGELEIFTPAHLLLLRKPSTPQPSS
eukprot:TRINITY_DN508_c0_g1_i1.p1 TRINITY_DN508_c0_g1~~TRINITY_DN508_c0_g1_i1.p1  ORF type:complete len:374 (+),score=68.59 TRINITY_DN508_c0_g1_i1:59-1180(+)